MHSVSILILNPVLTRKYNCDYLPSANNFLEYFIIAVFIAIWLVFIPPAKFHSSFRSPLNRQFINNYSDNPLILKKDDVNTQALVSINGGAFLLLTFASFGEEGPPLIEISACV